MDLPKISRRHHYIPQFHLKGFLNDGGKIYLFDKVTKKISRTNTKNVLLKKDRNLTVDSNGEKNDLLEKIYSSIEEVSVPVFDEIVKQKHEIKFSHYDKLSLSIYVATLYWRLPTSDEASNRIRNENGFDAVPFNLFKKNGTVANNEERKKVLSNENIKKAYRLFLPFASFYDQDYVNQVLKWRFLFNDPGYFLICDNPIIKKNKVKNPNILNEFIVPLSKDCLLINNDIISTENWSKEFFVQMGVAMFKQAERFVCGHNKLFLEKINEHYNVYERYNKTDRILPDLFKMVEK